ncbi:MAG: hypothetical protein DSZ23_03495 [Thermodesulfatator sp.]|nr:MAG: hypothetical protein DSZ23_03495 [Thermodesulfatator sp.]
MKLQICFIININQCPAGKNIFCSARQLDMNHHGHFADISRLNFMHSIRSISGRTQLKGRLLGN